jgi:Cu-processing system permease protein
MYFYNAREFTELLLAQPLRRRDIFLGQYIAVAGSLSSAILIGIGIPFFLFGIHRSDMLAHFLILTGLGIILSFIFTALAFLIAQRNENRMKGFGIAIFAWLFLGILYDGLFILLLSWLSEYPLENVAIAGVFLNPIDLARILILLKLDISALMGYTGAVFQRFIGTQYGMVIAAGLLFCWIVLPLWEFLAVSAKKDY